jgi:hypothetical protein
MPFLYEKRRKKAAGKYWFSRDELSMLVLKVEGDKVTGTISSDQGGGPISGGSWKEGALSIAFDVNGTAVTMVGAIKDGKLVGTLDLGGQMQMPWAAVKKQ